MLKLTNSSDNNNKTNNNGFPVFTFNSDRRNRNSINEKNNEQNDIINK